MSRPGSKRYYVSQSALSNFGLTRGVNGGALPALVGVLGSWGCRDGVKWGVSGCEIGGLGREGYWEWKSGPSRQGPPTIIIEAREIFLREMGIGRRNGTE